jgi:DeoR/GlpR family transcriptional regulator of sugar metabolism
VILAADSGKFESAAFVKYADWKEIDLVVTDSHVPASVRAWLNKAVKEVIYAKAP